ncbi:MAG TPA: gas vesicle protein GvpN [Myxococcales bacterium]|jgi:gas vesicle protein GvpN|nr:gas vesicle protein GvpN [Myxococcales bacterium]
MSNGKAQALAAVEEAPAPAPAQESMVVEASEGFVLTPSVQHVADRALAYLRAGYPVHFSGPAGTGKTTLALHVASLRNRPVTLMHGDDELGSSDLVGAECGYRRSKVVDNFIHSVVKTEESMSTMWADNRLTLACRNGDTLVYDEFTRSKPEANNALLSVLEERLLTLPRRRVGDGDGFMEVHPEFRAVFTSNPEEYAGVHRTQDALMDRLITIKVDYHDRDTEVSITRSKSGISLEEAEVIVDIVREVRGLGLTKQGPSLRACIMISRITMQQGARARPGDSVFTDVCRDVLGSLPAKVVRDGSNQTTVDDVVARHLRDQRRNGRGHPAAVPLLAAIQEGA